jgi:signal transduction histidine kinase
MARWLASFPLHQARHCLVSGLVILLLTLLFAAAIDFVIPLFVPQSNHTLIVLLTLCALLVFALLYARLSAMLDTWLHPERLAYRKFAEQYGQTLQQASGLTDLFRLVGQTLFSALSTASASIWLYRAEENVLALAHFEGLTPPDDLSELPVDILAEHLNGSQDIASLPESALHRGCITLGVLVIRTLKWDKRLIGMIGVGRPRLGGGYDRDAVLLLDWLADQVTLAVRNFQLEAELAETLNNVQMAYRQTIEVQEKERRGLAAELHDDILGRLTTMALTLRNCRKRIGTSEGPVSAWLEEVEKETFSVNQRLREITQGLHPTVLTNLGLISAIQAYLDYIARQPLPDSAPHVITLTAQGFESERIPDTRLERDVYHITRQALDNAIAHANAQQVYIHLRWSSDAVSVTVQDTGQGMTDAPERLMGQRGHLGLLSMHERVRAWGGRLTFNTAAGHGTTVRASIPINQPSRFPAHLQAFTHHLSRRTQT